MANGLITESILVPRPKTPSKVPAEPPFERIEFHSPPGWTKMIDDASKEVFGTINRSALIRAAVLEYLKSRGIKTV